MPGPKHYAHGLSPFARHRVPMPGARQEGCPPFGLVLLISQASLLHSHIAAQNPPRKAGTFCYKVPLGSEATPRGHLSQMAAPRLLANFLACGQSNGLLCPDFLIHALAQARPGFAHFRSAWPSFGCDKLAKLHTKARLRSAKAFQIRFTLLLVEAFTNISPKVFTYEKSAWVPLN